MKVHVIEADMSGPWQDAVQKRDDLGRAIGKLAAQANESVWFHDFKEPVAGAPVIMLECSDAFLAQVQKLPGFSKSQDLWQDMETERAPSIQKYFTQPPAPPKTPKHFPRPPRP